MTKNDVEIQRIISTYGKTHSLKRTAQLHGCSIATALKYVKKYSQIVKPQTNCKGILNDNEMLLGLYFGLWAGDGTQYRDPGYRIKICTDNCSYNSHLLIKEVIMKLFGKRAYLNTEKNSKRAYLKFNSKFVFNLASAYLSFDPDNKTLTVQLHKTKGYSAEFIQGYMLGLALSDGYLKNCFRFNVTSQGLADDAFNILVSWSFNPRFSREDRAEKGWNDLFMVRLVNSESRVLESKFDDILLGLGHTNSFREIKYEPEEI